MTLNKRLKPEYAEALLVYAITTEPLKSITDRFGLRYNTVCNYIRRNYPTVITRHKALLPKKDPIKKRLDSPKESGKVSKSRPSKIAKYAEAVALLTEMKQKQCNLLQSVAEKANVNYHALRLHVYTYHRELIGLDPSKNRGQCSSRSSVKYANAIAILASEPKQPENFILHVAEKLGLSYHALRAYIYVHHPELAQRSRKKHLASSTRR